MEERDIRVENLKAMVAKAGGTAAFVRQHPGLDPTYISQLMNGHRSFGERSARNMEARIGLPRGALDGARPATSDTWPFQMISQERYDKLPEHVRGIAEGKVLAVIEEWEASLVKSSDAANAA